MPAAVFSNSHVPADWTWTHYAAAVGGGVLSDGEASAGLFLPGTAFVKARLSINVNGSTNFITWRDVTLQEVAPGMTPQTEQPILDLADVDSITEETVLPISQYESGSVYVADMYAQSLIKVDPNERYLISGVAVDGEQEYLDQLWLLSYDIDQKLIHPLHVQRFGDATDTRIVSDVNPGDTSILLEDASGWSNSVFASAHTRALTWYGYQDSTGHVYPDYTYTRNVASELNDGMWAPGGIVFDAVENAWRMTLREPWAGLAISAGTAIRNSQSDLVQSRLTTQPDADFIQFGRFENRLAGTWKNGQRNEDAFRPGTAFIQPATFLDWSDLRIIPERAALLNRDEVATFAGGHVVTTNQSQAEILGDRFISVTTSDKYEFAVTAEFGDTRDADVDPVESHTFGFASYDADQLQILAHHVTKFDGAADTTLVQALSPGDTQIVLTDATGWSNSPAYGHTRSLAWYGYSNSFGETYTYTRHVAFDEAKGLWAAGGITGNVITLREPWAGPELPAGAAVRNATGGPEIANQALPTDVETWLGEAEGEWQGGQQDFHAFRPGTAYIRAAASLNRSVFGADDTVTITDFRISRTTNQLASATATANQEWTVPLDVLRNDFESDDWEIIAVNQPQWGSVQIVANDGSWPGISSQQILVYESPAWFVGSNRTTYTIRQTTTGEERSAIAQWTIRGSNFEQDADVAATIADQGNVILGNAAPEPKFRQFLDNQYRIASGDVLRVDSLYAGLLTNKEDPDGGVIATRLVTGPAHGSLSLSFDGTFEYAPSVGFFG